MFMRYKEKVRDPSLALRMTVFCGAAAPRSLVSGTVALSRISQPRRLGEEKGSVSFEIAGPGILPGSSRRGRTRPPKTSAAHSALVREVGRSTRAAMLSPDRKTANFGESEWCLDGAENIGNSCVQYVTDRRRMCEMMSIACLRGERSENESDGTCR